MADIELLETASVSPPGSGYGKIYIDTSGNLCFVDDADNVRKIAGLGDYTLTIPATGTVALLGTAQSFTATQTIAPTLTTSHGLEINMPTSTTSNALRMSYNSVLRLQMSNDADDTFIQMVNVDLGNDVSAPFYRNGRNTSGGAVGPSAGTFRYVSAAGTTFSTWVDAANNLRIHTAAPTGSSGAPTVSDTAGTVVGTQTSWHALKQNIVEHAERDALLDAVLALKLYDFEMARESLKRSDNERQSYTGLVIYESDRQGNAWFADNLGKDQVPVLNERNLFGYLIGAIQALAARVQELENAK